MACRRLLNLLICAMAVACATPSRRAPRPTPEELVRLKEAERLYRARDPAFDQVRDELAARPRTAYWLTAMFITYVLESRESRRATEAEFLRAAIGRRDPVEVRAFEQLRAVGAAAVPCVVESLLEHRFSDRRRLGVEILAAIGAPALAPLRPVLAHRDARLRRYAVEALAEMEPLPEVEAALERALTDPEFTVRVAAVRGLARAGARHAARLRRVLGEDGDPFVRRVAAEALGRFSDRATAQALVAYYERALEEGDRRGVMAADESLRRIAGVKRGSGLAGWKVWLSSWSPGGR